jgi:hypothetical protein
MGKGGIAHGAERKEKNTKQEVHKLIDNELILRAKRKFSTVRTAQIFETV